MKQSFKYSRVRNKATVVIDYNFLGQLSYSRKSPFLTKPTVEAYPLKPWVATVTNFGF